MVNLPEWRKTWVACVAIVKRWEIDAEGKILVNEWVCDEWGWIDTGTIRRDGVFNAEPERAAASLVGTT